MKATVLNGRKLSRLNRIKSYEGSGIELNNGIKRSEVTALKPVFIYPCFSNGPITSR